MNDSYMDDHGSGLRQWFYKEGDLMKVEDVILGPLDAMLRLKCL